MSKIKKPKLNRGRYLGMSLGNDCYAAPYYSVEDVDLYIEETDKRIKELEEAAKKVTYPQHTIRCEL